MIRHISRAPILLGLLALGSFILQAQTPVGSDRLLNAAKEPQNWMIYGGDYSSNRHSTLTQITPANVKNLGLAWAYQSPTTGSWQATPLVVDGVMYLTQRPNDVVALDAVTGRVFWMYRYNNASEIGVCCGANNRGLAILGDTLFMGTLDAHLVAIDTKSGMPVWKTKVGESKLGYSLTVAPLAIKDRVVVGLGGGEFGIRGAIAAFDAKTGKELWRFNTIPAPGEPGHETWEPCPPNPATYCDPEGWKHGGGSVWVTGSYDPALNLTYWGTGNVGPDYNPDQRPGDNLYTASVLALDLDSGKLKWHYQFTPHDRYDYDSVQVPVLADITFQGAPLKALLWANRNGNFYVLNRETGKFMLGNPAPFVPTPDAPTRGIPGAPGVPNLRRGPVNNWTDAAGHGAVLAIDPNTGEPKWRFMMYDVTDTGIVTTASDLLFTGGREGYLQALDARTGTLLWKQNLGAQMLNNPMTYAVNGKQYVAAMGGLTLFVFALP